jgi:HEAT repeat protein
MHDGVGIGPVLRSIVLDSGEDWYPRGEAARALGTVDAKGVVADLLQLFFSQLGEHELWETALTLEALGNLAAIQPLVRALHDANPYRCQAAARALGWIPYSGKSAAIPLTKALLDRSQPQAVREEAAESLAYLGYAGAVPALISVLEEPDVRIRFWAVFALGSLGRTVDADERDARIVTALKRMLDDGEVPPGNWWSVSREALALLGDLTPSYRPILQAEITAVLNDPQASSEDRSWAESYS